MHYMEDQIFKHLMRNNKKLLVTIIKGVEKGISYEKAMKGEFIINELDKSNIHNKNKITDLIYKIDNIYINIEMNKYWYKGIMKKNLDYLKEISLYYNRKDKEEKEYIQINIDNYERYGKDVYNTYYLENRKYNIIEDKKYKIIHINLVKAREIKYTKSELIKTLQLMEMDLQ